MNEKKAKEIFENKKFLAYGKRGIVSVYKNYVIKERRQDSDSLMTIENESEFNIKLNKLGIGPKFYFKDKDNKFLIREFIVGKTIYDWITTAKNSEIKKVILNVLNQCRAMDKARINKFEMTNPHKDLIINKSNKPFIIDFERCRKTNKTKNVTQFLQFLSHGKMSFELKDRKIILDKKIILELSTNYKKEMKEKEFKKIKDYLKQVFSF